MPDVDKIMPVTQVKRELLELLKSMGEEDAIISVTRNGEPIGVMMTHRRYDALMETIEILADRNVMASLEASAQDFSAGRTCADKDIWRD